MQDSEPQYTSVFSALKRKWIGCDLRSPPPLKSHDSLTIWKCFWVQRSIQKWCVSEAWIVAAYSTVPLGLMDSLRWPHNGSPWKERSVKTGSSLFILAFVVQQIDHLSTAQHSINLLNALRPPEDRAAINSITTLDYTLRGWRITEEFWNRDILLCLKWLDISLFKNKSS